MLLSCEGNKITTREVRRDVSGTTFISGLSVTVTCGALEMLTRVEKFSRSFKTGSNKPKCLALRDRFLEAGQRAVGVGKSSGRGKKDKGMRELEQ